MLRAKNLFWIYTAFVIYGTLLPFQIAGSMHGVLENIQAIQRIPFWNTQRGRIASIPDIVQNIILFIPIGFLGIQYLKRKIVPTLIAGFLVSALVETLQLFTLNRTTSATDLATNALGTICGVMLADGLMPFLKKISHLPSVRTFSSLPGGTHLLVLLLYTLIYALEPFDFTLDVSSVWGHVRILFRELFHPTFVLKDELVLASQFALFGFAVAGVFAELRIKAVFRVSLCSILFWAVITELSQIFVASRTASIITLCFSLVGGGIGLMAYRWHLKAPRKQALFMFYMIFVMSGYALSILSPFDYRDIYLRPARLPFEYYYADSFFHAFSNILHALLIFVPLGYVAAYMGFRRKITLIILGLLFLTQVIFESLQGFIDTRYPDVTDIFIPTLGAMIGYVLGKRIQLYLSSYSMKGIGTETSKQAGQEGFSPGNI